MSRCFPFPPPGYEQNIRTDDVNLSVKEKNKHKRHKDKKERGERKEKEKGEDKTKENGRKRKKHRDKKDKKKDKSRSLEDKKAESPLVNQNGDKIAPDSKPSNGFHDYTILVELSKRFRNDGASDCQMVDNITIMEQKMANLPGGMLAEAHDDIKDKSQNSRMANGQSLKVESPCFRNGLFRNLSGENQNKAEGHPGQGNKVKKLKEEKEKVRNIHKNGDSKGDRDKSKKEGGKKRKKEKARESKEQIKASDILKNDGNNHGNLPICKETQLNGFLHDNGIDPSNIPRPVSSSHHASQNATGHAPSRNIINLAVEKGGGISSVKVNAMLSSFQPPVKSLRDAKPSQNANNFSADPGRTTINNYVNGGQNGTGCAPQSLTNLAVETGGGIQSRKVNAVLSFSKPAVKSSRDVKPGQNADNVTADRGRTTITNCVNSGVISSQFLGIGRTVEQFESADNAKMDYVVPKNCGVDDQLPSLHPLKENGRKSSHKMVNKESGINGITEGKIDTSSRPLSAPAKAKERVNSSAKPPHPDLKYLSQILTVPTVERQPESDDQEWLFACKDSQVKRPKLASDQIEGTKHVWAEAMRVDSMDVTALPYVIPF